MIDGGAGPHEKARANAFAQAVAEAMEELSDEAREALHLVTLEGLDYQEAADLAGRPGRDDENPRFPGPKGAARDPARCRSGRFPGILKLFSAQIATQDS